VRLRIARGAWPSGAGVPVGPAACLFEGGLEERVTVFIDSRSQVLRRFAVRRRCSLYWGAEIKECVGQGVSLRLWGICEQGHFVGLHVSSQVGGDARLELVLGRSADETQLGWGLGNSRS